MVTPWVVGQISIHLNKLKARLALNGNPVTELRDVICHMGSLSVTGYPTQVNAPRLNPSPQVGTRFTYPGGMKSRVDLGGWVHLLDGLPVRRQSPIPVVSGLSVD